tara:strand:- start:27 stop:863 length:837 start_codon:yes stop_codon:yes gene_type:complete
MKDAYVSEIWEQNPLWFNEISGKQGFQLWTVPETATYRIEAKGAYGGKGGNNNQEGGRGGHVKADFALTKNTKLVIIVGQAGENGLDSSSVVGGSGGGASWVLKPGAFTATSDVYLVAGGGTGGFANTTWTGRGSTPGSSQGSSTAGGAAASNTIYNPGGGAGYGGNAVGGTGVTLTSKGYKPSNGATGGYGGFDNNNDVYYNRYGGFGGGGGNGAHSSGGGAGYGGGQAQYYGTDTGAASSTSFIMTNGTGGLTISNRTFENAHTSGLDGTVIITKL